MIKTFPLNSRSKVTGLKQPKELFAFSRDENGNFSYDTEEVQKNNLPYYYFPDSYVDKGIDLKAGLSSFKKIPEQENLGDYAALLKATLMHEQQVGAKVQADIITFRGLMTKLLILPYNLKESVDFHIATFDGQIFIKNNDEVELKRRQHTATPLHASNDDYQKRCEYSGYKFETVTTLPKPWADCSRELIEGRSKNTVNNYEQYISAARTGIGKVKILLAGEIDCIWDYIPEKKDILSHYVELKTSAMIENPGSVVKFERKLFKAWAQSFLIGIRRIVYGFRDTNFILRDVEIYNTEEIPLMLKDSINENQKIICMNAIKWYGAVLEWISTELPRDKESYWSLSYDPSTRSFSLQEILDDTLVKKSIITDEFRQWRQHLPAT